MPNLLKALPKIQVWNEGYISNLYRKTNTPLTYLSAWSGAALNRHIPLHSIPFMSTEDANKILDHIEHYHDTTNNIFVKQIRRAINR